MANYSPPFRTENALGGNFMTVNVFPSPGDGYDTPHQGIGTEYRGTDGSRFMFVKFIAAVNQGDTVIIDRNGNAQQITTALAAAGIGRVGTMQAIGGAPAPAVLNDGRTAYGYGWVALEGNDLLVNVATGVGAGVPLATTAVPGVLGPTAGGQTTIGGIATNVANTSGAVALTSCAASDLRLIN